MNAPRPDCCTDAMLYYLDREGTFHLGADSARLALEFPLTNAEAASVVLYWMETVHQEVERR